MANTTARAKIQSTDYASLAAEGYTTVGSWGMSGSAGSGKSGSTILMTASSVQVPIQTFAAVPKEEVPGEKEPACGKGMAAKACPPLDDGM